MPDDAVARIAALAAEAGRSPDAFLTDAILEYLEDLEDVAQAEARLNDHHGDLLPTVLEALDALALPPGERRLVELGCGNGSVARVLSQRGWEVTGVDPSEEGIAEARVACPELKLATGSAYDAFDDFAGQRNDALDRISFKYEWVLHLDADEIVTPALHAEMLAAIADGRFDAWRVPSRILATEEHGRSRKL